MPYDTLKRAINIKKHRELKTEIKKYRKNGRRDRVKKNFNKNDKYRSDA
jgi:hypothetical protein